MAKIVRLTESELVRLVKKIINESPSDYNATNNLYTLYNDPQKTQAIGMFNRSSVTPGADRIIVTFQQSINPQNVGKGTNKIHYKCDGNLKLALSLSYNQNPTVYNDKLLNELNNNKFGKYCESGKFLNPTGFNQNTTQPQPSQSGQKGFA